MRLKQTKRRHSFLLLETLLAVAMIGICSSYVISTPVKVYQNHLEDLKKIELNRLADRLFIQIQYNLKERHPWNTLVEESKQIHSLEDITLNISPLFNTTYQCGYTIRVKKTKEGENGTLYKLLECIIYITPAQHPLWDQISSSRIIRFPYLIFTSASPQRRPL